MLRWHRICAVLTLPLLLYVVVTGAGIQMWDMIALVGHAPEIDPNMLMMRQHIYGTPNYAVVSAPDYTSPALAVADEEAAMAKAAALGRKAVPGADLRLVELRMVHGRPAAHVQMGARHLIFDLASGGPLPTADLPPPQPDRDFASPRSDFKYFHRFNYIGQPAIFLDAIAGIALAVMIGTGLAQYWKLWQARARIKGPAPFWQGGSRWRALHRWTSLVSAILIGWIALSGLALSIDNVGPLVLRMVTGAQQHGKGPNGFDGDFSAPINDADIPGMVRTTLIAYRAQVPGTGLKVLRLRYFSGYAQGVVIAADAASTQHVFNARSGAAMSMTEPGYPHMGFLAGWEWHQRLKRIHRGDIFGMTGRWLDSLGGIALLYLLGSGIVMYWQLWRRRAASGRTGILWR